MKFNLISGFKNALHLGNKGKAQFQEGASVAAKDVGVENAGNASVEKLLGVENAEAASIGRLESSNDASFRAPNESSSELSLVSDSTDSTAEQGRFTVMAPDLKVSMAENGDMAIQSNGLKITSKGDTETLVSDDLEITFAGEAQTLKHDDTVLELSGDKYRIKNKDIEMEMSDGAYRTKTADFEMISDKDTCITKDGDGNTLVKTTDDCIEVHLGGGLALVRYENREGLYIKDPVNGEVVDFNGERGRELVSGWNR